MAKRISVSILLAASILPACDSGTINAQQANASATADSAAAASAAPGRANQPGARCSFSGWSSDPDPNGLNIRSAPSATASILGRLPPPEDHPDNETAFGATFDVVESRNGWFRIENARRWSEDHREASRLPAGWISGRYVTFQLHSDKVFAEPDPSSAVLLTSWDEDGTLMQFRYRNPTECAGEWVRLTAIGRDGRERQGWARGICGLQETTCDGVRGDLLEQDENRGWTAMD